MLTLTHTHTHAHPRKQESGFLLDCDGQDTSGLDQQHYRQQADSHQLQLDDDISAYDLADAQRRASVVIHMLELLHERCAGTVTFRRAFALRCFFALWRGGHFIISYPENEDLSGGEEEEGGGVLVAAAGGGSARHMIDTCVSLVEDILHPEEQQQQQQQQQPRPQQQQQQQQQRPPSSTFRPVSSLRERERESPAPSFVSAASLADMGRERLLRKEVANLQGKVQALQEVQNVLLDILATYERKLREADLLDVNLSDSGEGGWWEEGSASGGSRGGKEGEGDDLTAILSGGRSGSRAGGGGGGRGGGGGGGGELLAGGAYLIRRLEHYFRSVHEKLEERKALIEHVEGLLANCVCQSR